MASCEAFVMMLLAVASCKHASADLTSHHSSGTQIVVATMDGKVHGLDADDGMRLWSFASGGMLVSSSTSDESAVFVPGLDGSVYSLREGEGMKRMGVSTQDIVRMSPFVDMRDDSVYLGSKETKFFSVDTSAGSAETVDAPGQCFEGSKQLFFGRSEHIIRVLDTKTGQEKWNVTVAQFVSHLDPLLEEDVYPDDPVLVITEEGRLLRYSNDKQGELMWDFSSGSVVVSAFVLPYGETTMRRVNTANEKANANGYLPGSSVYVGSSGGQIWASPFPLLPEELPQGHQWSQGLIDAGQPDSSSSLVLYDGSSAPFHMMVPLNGTIPLLVDRSDWRGGSDGSDDVELPASEEGTDSTTLLLLVSACMLLLPLAAVWASLPRRRGQAAANEKKAKKKKKKRQKEEEAAAAAAMAPPPVPGVTEIGKLTVFEDQILGYGSHGTVVFSGRLEGREVAVKRMLKEFFDIAEHEVQAIVEADQHNNVVRYYMKEECLQGVFIYVALELCTGTVADLVPPADGGKGRGRSISTPLDFADLLDEDGLPSDSCRILLAELCSGVAHLHNLNIVHRDIKPSNLLLSKQNSCKIADFGQMRKLELEQSSFDTHSFGTAGWKAPEVVTGGRCTRAVDIFSLGLVFYYVLSGGHHPFGSRVEREANIAKGRRAKLHKIQHFPPAVDVVSRMIARDPQERISMEWAQAHPLMWSPAKQLAFLLDASDRIEIDAQSTPMGPLVAELETHAKVVMRGGTWDQHLDSGLLDNLGKYRKYDTSSVRDLLRVIRNKRNHYQDLPEEVRQSLGELPQGFLTYFITRFPSLLISVHKTCRGSDTRGEPQFKQYFEVEGSG